VASLHLDGAVAAFDFGDLRPAGQNATRLPPIVDSSPSLFEYFL
jgi:hypothetical protein